MQRADPPPPDDPASDEEEGTSSNEEQPAAKEGSSKTKTPQGLAKHTWILTYGASGPYINEEMLKDLGKFKVRECHSTKDRAIAVTYINLTNRVRKPAIEKFMGEAKKKHGIVQNAIYGYESVACVDQKDSGSSPATIEEHVGFKLLLRHYLAKNPAFVPWTDGEPELKRGSLFKAATVDPDKPKKQTYRQRYTAVKRDLEQLQAEHTRVLQDNSTLRTENAAQKRKIQELERN